MEIPAKNLGQLTLSPNKPSISISIWSLEPQKFKSDAFKYFILLSNFGYYFLILPYKLKVVKSEVVLSYSKTRTILCGVIHIWTILEAAFRLWSASLLRSKTFRENPSALYNLVTEMADVTCVSIFIISAWKRREAFDKMCKAFNGISTGKIQFSVKVFFYIRYGKFWYVKQKSKMCPYSLKFNFKVEFQFLGRVIPWCNCNYEHLRSTGRSSQSFLGR